MKLPAYAKYLFEVLAIFVGITLSFMVDEWREDKQNREETVKALKMIREDLVQDTLSYNRILQSTELYDDLYKFQVLNDMEKVDSDSTLNLFVASWARSPNIFPIAGFSAFENLENRIIDDSRILKQISLYYSYQRFDQVYERVDDFSIDQIHNSYLAVDQSYLNLFLNRMKMDTTNVTSWSYDSFMATKWELTDSSEQVEIGFNKFIVNLKNYMKSETYKKRLGIKRSNELMWWGHAITKKQWAQKLIQLIDEELKK